MPEPHGSPRETTTPESRRLRSAGRQPTATLFPDPVRTTATAIAPRITSVRPSTVSLDRVLHTGVHAGAPLLHRDPERWEVRGRTTTGQRATVVLDPDEIRAKIHAITRNPARRRCLENAFLPRDETSACMIAARCARGFIADHARILPPLERVA